jgi:hypothetical protein
MATKTMDHTLASQIVSPGESQTGRQSINDTDQLRKKHRHGIQYFICLLQCWSPLLSIFELFPFYHLFPLLGTFGANAGLPHCSSECNLTAHPIFSLHGKLDILELENSRIYRNIISGGG